MVRDETIAADMEASIGDTNDGAKELEEAIASALSEGPSYRAFVAQGSSILHVTIFPLSDKPRIFGLASTLRAGLHLRFIPIFTFHA